MTLRSLAIQGAMHYRRMNAAVVLGIACAVAVLAGALLVGESVRASLADLSLGRLGRTDVVIASDTFFGEELAGALSPALKGRATDATPMRHPALAGPEPAPMLVAEALVTSERTRRRALAVQVYGVDDRFWAFHGVQGARPTGSDAWLSPALAREIGSAEGDVVLVRTRKRSAIPGEFLHGRRDDVGRTMRLRAAGVLARSQLGEFSLRPRQGDVRALFMPLARLQRDLEQPGKVNTVLVSCAACSDSITQALRAEASLEDLGIRVREVPGVVAQPFRAASVESLRGVLDGPAARAVMDAAQSSGVRAVPLFTYVANSIRHGEREVPYSLVTAMELSALTGAPAGRPSAPLPSIVLNDWTARQLEVSGGERVTIAYFVWSESGRLEERTAEFTVAGIVPVDAADRDFVPDYPGIGDARSLSDWEPPFPVDLSRVRPVDEEYWQRHRTTPKAFIALEAGQQLWRSRYGQLTSVRVGGSVKSMQAFAASLRETLAPVASGIAVVPVRDEALRASSGATDFGAYFTYFSFFLVVSALLLAGLFFRLGLEQRVPQIGVLRAIGFSPGRLRALFLMEAASLMLAGCVLGVLGAIAYAWLILLALRTVWVGAVGTTLLELHASPGALASGALGGALAGFVAIVWTLASLGRASPRALLSGDVSAAFAGAGKVMPPVPGLKTRATGMRTAGMRTAGMRSVALPLVLFLAAALLTILAWAGAVADAAAFFGAGTLLLGGLLATFRWRLMGPSRGIVDGAARWPVARLGVRYASWRRGRSVLAASLIAAAVFLIVSVEAFRREESGGGRGRQSGTGGYALVGESMLPVYHDPGSAEGREALNLTRDAPAMGTAATFTSFRLREGDDASCVNLYRPQRPRVIGAPPGFIESARFAFRQSIEPASNPWLLLRRREPGGAIPAIADATSLQYVLHLKVGDELTMDEGGRAVRLRIVASLADSVLQGELIIDEQRFLEVFPHEEGYRFFLIDLVDAPGPAIGQAAAFLEDRLAGVGFDAVGAGDRLAAFHRVENTYLSTFQALGGLGLLLGTIGLAAIAARNVLERRRELALLRALGYRGRDLSTIIVAENALLLAVGMVAGIAAAVVAIAPVLFARGGALPAPGVGVLLLAVFAAGVLSSAGAARAASRAPLLEALRSE